MKTNPGGWIRDLIRSLSRIDPYQPAVYLPILGFVLTGILIYEGGQLGYANPRYWLSVAISLPIFIGLYFLLMLPFKTVTKLKTSGLGKLAVFLLVGAVRSVIAAFIALEDPAAAMQLLSERGPGDISVSAILWAALATISSANADYKLSLAELNRVSQELEAQRQKRSQAAALADQRLKELAVASLSDELGKISAGLGAASKEKDIWKLSAEIKQLIENKVRPLSHELRSRIDLLSDVNLEPVQPLSRGGFLNLTVSPRKDPKFLLAYLVSSINVFITVYQLAGLDRALIVQLISLSFPLISWLISLTSKPKVRFGFGIATLWMVMVSVAAYTPTLWILNVFSRADPNLVRIQLTAFLVFLFVSMAFTGWSAAQRIRNEQLAAIAASNAELRRELALIDQAVWVAQRKWSYLVHGTVQGALTVAGSRLVFAKNPGPEIIAQVVKDIEKAKAALEKDSAFPDNTSQLLEEIVRSWDGICQIRFEVSDQTRSRLDLNESGRTCFIELSKELIGNAYRHGKAKTIWISGYLDSHGDIRVISSNDGEKIDASATPGLGFAMFDELTSSWAIENHPDQRFVATIPLAEQN